MAEVDDDDFRLDLIFVPMLDADDLDVARERMAEYADDRVTYFWDPEFFAGYAYSTVFDLDDIVWDIYFLYGREAEWQELPTRPALAMKGHQKMENKIELWNVERFAEQADDMLDDGDGDD